MSGQDEEMDASEMWREVHEASRDRRAGNRESSAALLREKGVAFQERNSGAHLIIEHGGKAVDFWPGTGKWVDRNDRTIKRRGVFNLLKYLGVAS